MDRVRIGSTLRAIRLELRLRQRDVAERAGLCQQTVSNIECGRVGPMTLDTLDAVAGALQADLALAVRWRGAKVARLVDRRHARLQNRVVALLTEAGWEIEVEETFNRYGEKGSVDILAWQADCRALAVIEIKADLVDLQDTVRTLGMKARVVPEVVRRSRGWRPEMLATILVLPDANVHRNAVAQYAALLAAALPARTREVRDWLRCPDGNLRGIWFVPYTSPDGAIQSEGSVQRVFRPRKRPAAASRPGKHLVGAPRASQRTAQAVTPGPTAPATVAQPAAKPGPTSPTPRSTA